MKFWLVVLGMLRTRRVAATVAISSLSVAALAYFLVPAHYTSTATLVLTTSPTNQASTAGNPNEQPAINPLLNFNEGLITAGAILVQSLNTTESMERLGADGGPTSVTISAAGGAQQLGVNGPFLYIAGDSTASPDEARAVVLRAKDLASQVLKQRQEELRAPPSQLIGLLFVVQPTQPVADHGNADKAAVLGLVLALTLSLGAFYYTDVVRGKRSTVLPTAPSGPRTIDPEPVQDDRTGLLPPPRLHTDGVGGVSAVPVSDGTSDVAAVPVLDGAGEASAAPVSDGVVGVPPAPSSDGVVGVPPAPSSDGSLAPPPLPTSAGSTPAPAVAPSSDTPHRKRPRPALRSAATAEGKNGVRPVVPAPRSDDGSSSNEQGE